MNPGWARKSVERVFMRVWEIIKLYKTNLKHKHIIEMLMKNLHPPRVAKEIYEMFKAGDEDQQEARKDLVTFHDLLEKMAIINEKSMQFGFYQYCPTVAPEKKRRHKEFMPRFEGENRGRTRDTDNFRGRKKTPNSRNEIPWNATTAARECTVC